MRTIKFRAWDKKEKEMISHNRLFRLDTSNELPFLPLLEKFKDEYEVMEHTGLTDKNGKEIYEGDVVACYKNNPSVVVFDKGTFGILTNGVFDSFHELLGECEVIGNRFEHPELLEQPNAN